MGTAFIAIAWIAASSNSSGPVKHEVVFAQTNSDYSKFQHSNPNHSRLPCLLCHRRENNAAQPTLPGKDQHTPCTGCHAPLFANQSGAICTICHSEAGAKTLKAFPPLQSFGSKFDHALHIKAGAGCGSCHRPANRGVALTIPTDPAFGSLNLGAAIFSEAALHVYADGLMSYGPTRTKLAPLLAGYSVRTQIDVETASLRGTSADASVHRPSGKGD